jgi:hypothetical protein
VVDGMIMQHFSGGTTVNTGETRLATVAHADVDPRVDPVEDSRRPVAGRRTCPR